MKMKIFFSIFKPLIAKHTLSNRLLTYILFSSGMLAIVITLVQLFWDFNQDVDKIEESITQIESSFLEPMAASLWNLDEEQIEIQIAGIMKLSDMQFVRINEVIGNTEVPMIDMGMQQEKYDISKKFKLIYQGEVVGNLFVAASLKKVYNRLKAKSLVILISQTIKTMIVSMAILLIIYYMVIRHINKIAIYTRDLKFTSDSESLILDGNRDTSTPDELDELVFILNRMQKKIVTELENKKDIIDELQQERDFSATIINSSNTVICCLDHDLIIETINPAAVALTGYTQDELLQKNWLDVFVVDEQKQKLLDFLENSETVDNLEIVMPSLSEGVTTLLWTFSHFYAGKDVKYLIGFGHNVTSQKHVELEFIQLNDQLEEKVIKRTSALTNSNKQIKETLDQLKRTQQTLIEAEKMASLGTLVAGVAHEINTPIGISVTAASYLQDEVKTLKSKLNDNTLTRSYVEQLIERVTESGNLLNNNLDRAASLISSFKQVAVDQSSEACYTFKLSENINQMVTSIKFKLKQANCQVYVSCPKDLTIYSFPGSFSQIYSNLILNSLIHGFDDWDGKHEIYIDISQKEDTLYIDYRDTGKGIPDEIASRIFEPFVTSKRGTGGSGLGTHIVYNIVNQLLKGDIQYIQAKEGVHFRLQIPYTPNLPV